MSTDLRTPAPDPPASLPPSSIARHRRRAWLLLAAAAWNAFVWFGRLSIVLDGGNSAPFRLVHGVLLVVSLAFAAAFAVVGVRMLRESRRAEAGG